MDGLGLDFALESGWRYVFVKPKNIIAKYKSPAVGMLLLLFHGEENLIPLSESDLSRYDCEIVEGWEKE